MDLIFVGAVTYITIGVKIWRIVDKGYLPAELEPTVGCAVAAIVVVRSYSTVDTAAAAAPCPGLLDFP